MGSYFPKPQANGICVHQISLALKNIGYDVHIICFKKDGDLSEDEFEGVYVHRVKPRFVYRLTEYCESRTITKRIKIIRSMATLIHRLKRLLFLPLYPMTSPMLIWRFYNTAVKLHQKVMGFDILLSVYNPFAALVAGAMVKKKFNNLKFVLYVLDTLTNTGGTTFLSSKQVEKKGWRWEKRIYKYADLIINMKCHETHHQQKRYDLYREKMALTDSPLFRPLKCDNESKVSPFDGRHQHWVYTGRLIMKSYDPWYAVKIFELLTTRGENIKFHFYSRGNCEDKLSKYEEKTGGAIIRHGFVESKEAIAAILGADFLVSFGTAEASMIPSKIFEYISTGKPIIHFYKQVNDVCIQYFERYPLALTIKQDETQLETNAERVMNFIKLNIGKRVKREEIEEYFIMNKPEYTANFINERLT